MYILTSVYKNKHNYAQIKCVQMISVPDVKTLFLPLNVKYVAALNADIFNLKCINIKFMFVSILTFMKMFLNLQNIK